MATWVMAPRYRPGIDNALEYLEMLKTLPECEAPKGYVEVVTLEARRKDRQQ